MDTIHAFLLALVQGATEFLPISSSGHLVLASHFFGYRIQMIGFDVVLHGATLVAALLYFRRDIATLIIGCVKNDPLQKQYAYALFLGTVPTVIAGVLLYNGIDVFRAVPAIAVSLILSALLLLFADRYLRSSFLPTDIPLHRKGFLIGLFQAIAILPGVSRSGITMAAGRLTGFSRTESARFSFLLAIPVIAGALLLTAPQAVVTMPIAVLIVSACIAGAVAYSVIHLFLTLIERVGFAPFCIYQIALGVLLLLA